MSYLLNNNHFLSTMNMSRSYQVIFMKLLPSGVKESMNMQLPRWGFLYRKKEGNILKEHPVDEWIVDS